MSLKNIFIMGKGVYYYDPESFWIGIVFGIVMLLFGGLVVYNICARRLLKKGIGHLKVLKIITIIKDTLLIIVMAFALIAAVIDGDFFDIKFLTIYTFIVLVSYLAKIFRDKLHSKNSKKLLLLIEILCLIIIPFVFDYNSTDEETDEKIVIENFPVNDHITSKYDNHYTKVVEFEHNIHIMDITREPIYSQERYVECKDREIAQEIFQYIVIKADKECREILDYQEFMKDKSRNEWSSDEIAYRSYKKAIASFEKIDNYYIRHHYVIMLSHNKIIQIYVDDIDQINAILQQFIDFNL